MNYQIRTNETRHISQLIAPALLPFNVHDGKTIPPADGTIEATSRSQQFKVEEGGPVRPAERVPYSSSHYLFSQAAMPEKLFSQQEILIRARSASSGASFCPGTTDTDREVAAA